MAKRQSAMPATIAIATTPRFFSGFMSLRAPFCAEWPFSESGHSKMRPRKRPMTKTPARLLIAVLAAALAGTAAAQAQSRPLKIIVPFPPGNGTDILARLMSPKMIAATGQAVVVENRGGANGQIGAETVAHAAPDGTTILFTSPSTHVTAQFLSKNLPYDPIRDFTPITAAVEPVTLMTINPSLPVNSLKELIAYAKANPGKLDYSSPGVGAVFHMSGELFKLGAGVDIVHVPYKGAAPALQAVIAGEV